LGPTHVRTPFHHLSGDSHLHPLLGARPITASRSRTAPGDVAAVAAAVLINNAHHQCKTYVITVPEALTFEPSRTALSPEEEAWPASW
jgi:uncharacterized protein YbjT (DUF2867 family)